MNKLSNGDLLDDNDIKQTDLTTRLLEARADTDPKKFVSQSFRTNALKAIVGNQLMHTTVENGKVHYRDNWVDEYHAPYLVKSDIHSLLQKDRRMTLPEIKEWPKLNQYKTNQPVIKENIPEALYKEPSAPDITTETVFDLYTGARLGKGLLSLSRHAIGDYAEKQAAKRVILFPSVQGYSLSEKLVSGYDMIESAFNLSEKILMGNPIYVYYHTHWDREWYLPFRQYQYRLLKVVDSLLDDLEKDNLPSFTLDGQTVLLEDYLEFRPFNQKRIKQLVNKGKLSIGPWYVMPDEFLVSGESLIRNLYYGMQLASSFGETGFTGYIPDTFGHSADIPMIMNGFDIYHSMLWRGVKSGAPLFIWESPSGNNLLTYHLSKGYSQNIFHMGKNLEEKSNFIKQWLDDVIKLTPDDDMPILFPLGADHLGVCPDAFLLMKQFVPDAQTITPYDFMQVAKGYDINQLKHLTGELRNNEDSYILPGVYSSRMYLKQWNRRLEWRLSRQLEQLITWQHLAGIPVEHYNEELEFLWKTLLLNHPHDSICGCSVDSVHRENESRFEQIDQFSQSMLAQVHHDLCLNFQEPDSIVVFNLSDVTYTGVIEIKQDYPLEHPVPPATGQVISEETILDESYKFDITKLPLAENVALRRTSLIWVSSVQPHGIKHINNPEEPSDIVIVKENLLENRFIRLEIIENSLTATDKISGKIYNDLHQLIRNIEQGDSYNAAPRPGTLPEQAKLLSCMLIHKGPLRGTINVQFLFKSIQLVVDTEISINAGSPRIDFKTCFTNQNQDHKVQVAFKSDKYVKKVIAEGHFSPVERHYDYLYRIEECMPAPSQKELTVQGGPIQRFIGYNNQTLITQGLTEYEVEGNFLKLTLLRAFGILSRNDTGVRGSHAGPPLPTPEGQCLNRYFECLYAWLPGFKLDNAYNQTDWFYGGIYGFDKKEEKSNITDCSVDQSFFCWNNPHVKSSASLPYPNGFQLRLFNPTATAQEVDLKLPPGLKYQIHSINPNGRVLETLLKPKLAILPFKIQTLAITIE